MGRKATSIAGVLDTHANENGGDSELGQVLNLCHHLWWKELRDTGREPPKSKNPSSENSPGSQFWSYLAETLDLEPRDTAGSMSEHPTDLTKLPLTTDRLQDLGRALRSYEPS